MASLTGTNELLERYEQGERDLQGLDLSRVSLRGANLSGANLSGANLAKADLAHADLSRTILRGANLGFVNLAGADLTGADLRGANLGQAKLLQARLGLANLSRANLRGADLSYANLEQTQLEQTRLQGATLVGVSFAGASLVLTDLKEADLRESRLERALLERVWCDGATYDTHTRFPVGFDPVAAGMLLYNPLNGTTSLHPLLEPSSSSSTALARFDASRSAAVASLRRWGWFSRTAAAIAVVVLSATAGFIATRTYTYGALQRRANESLARARQAALAGEYERCTQALAAIPTTLELAATARALAQDCQQMGPLLQQATDYYQAGRLDAAIAALGDVPETSLMSGRARETAAKWLQEWHRNQTHYDTAQAALERDRWQAAIVATRQVNTDYWQARVVPFADRAHYQLALEASDRQDWPTVTREAAHIQGGYWQQQVISIADIAHTQLALRALERGEWQRAIESSRQVVGLEARQAVDPIICQAELERKRTSGRGQ
jgi:hypothetical protein